ncbi:Hypothetical predicted protein [Paramuricea clavata]|uniref:Cilia- and flagella-associated protein 206 n=1 Tax=Paramuricea clavata TaxID=317549 RepID=A0A6S7GRG0_PARCT|nr:Hypothetical predicted protein [Paramuricea clavata]
MSLSKRDKEKQLQELTQIVSGIRLFNRECGKGGDGVDDLPAILSEAMPATSSKVQSEIDMTLEMAYTFTAIVEHFLSEPDELPDDVPLILLKECLMNLRQLETFLSVILHDVVDCARQTEALEIQFKARMENLRNTVQSKTAVPTAQVYPQFINLSHIWTGFQDEMVLLSVLSNIQSSLGPFSKVIWELFPDEILERLLGGIEVKTDNDRLMEMSDENSRINPHDITRDDFEVLYPETTKNFDRLPILYRGFCAWSLVNDKSFVLPSNPAIGVLLYNNNYYAFSTKEASYQFTEDPEKYIADVASAAKKSPELIQLLELHAQFAAITPYQEQDSGRYTEAPITKCDSGTQTDTHFMESNIVKSYEWNEWELRRKAIKLANLRTRVTHSMQTDLSNYKRDNTTQVYLPKDGDTQTKREESTSVPKPSRYMAGLRGCNSTKTTITMVDLTLDVDQT